MRTEASPRLSRYILVNTDIKLNLGFNLQVGCWIRCIFTWNSTICFILCLPGFLNFLNLKYFQNTDYDIVINIWYHFLAKSATYQNIGKFCSNFAFCSLSAFDVLIPLLPFLMSELKLLVETVNINNPTVYVAGTVAASLGLHCQVTTFMILGTTTHRHGCPN